MPAVLTGLRVTYNFDPDRWLENRRCLLERQRDSGTLDARAFDEAVRELERRHEEMLARLDKTYQLPHASRAD